MPKDLVQLNDNVPITSFKSQLSMASHLFILMPVEIPTIQCHVYSTRSDLDRRPGIDSKAFATAVPIEDDPPVGYFYPAIL